MEQKVDMWAADAVTRDANQAERYWEQALKTLNLVNGGAALALLTFIGNHPGNTHRWLWALGWFAAGAGTSALAALASYAQLKWGVRDASAAEADRLGVRGEGVEALRAPPLFFSSLKGAMRWAETAAFSFVILGVVLFALGIGASVSALP